MNNQSILLTCLLILIATTVTALDDDVLIPYPFVNFYFSEQNEWTVFIAELSSQQAYLVSFRKEPLEFQTIEQFAMASGKQKGSKRSEWDLRTPEGLYQITRIRRQHTLHEKFGTGAFILDYPNLLDKTLLKTGSGIWIHGTDRVDFVDFDSEGCIRLKNEDITLLFNYLKPEQTPVLILDKIEWSTEKKILESKNRWLLNFQIWLEALKNKDLTSVLDLYHPTFYAPYMNMNITRWSLYLKEFLLQENSADLSFEITDIIYHDDYLLVRGEQTNRTEDSFETFQKVILWQKFSDKWLIVLEDKIEI